MFFNQTRGGLRAAEQILVLAPYMTPSACRLTLLLKMGLADERLVLTGLDDFTIIAWGTKSGVSCIVL